MSTTQNSEITNSPLLRVRNLSTHFRTEEGMVRAVSGVNFKINKGELFALVGESGCGKSITAMSIMRLVQTPPGKIEASTVALDGIDLLGLSEKQMQQVRGSKISMIFQEPMSSLNPVFTCGNQIMEAIELHRGLSSVKSKELAISLLSMVGIPDPSRRFSEYPHQMSGGMQQRVMIAMALSCNPKLLIADEPTTALDVTIQAQILDLLKDLQANENLGILFITHDLGVVAETADRVACMYASRICEFSDVNSLFSKPLHPYTVSLFRSLPKLGSLRDRLDTIPGTVPNPLHFPSGCTFHPRCYLTKKLASESDQSSTVQIDTGTELVRVLRRCTEAMPELREIEKGHWCSCGECPGYGQAKPTDPSE